VLEGFDAGRKEAEEMIMSARVLAGWITAEELEPPAVEGEEDVAEGEEPAGEEDVAKGEAPAGEEDVAEGEEPAGDEAPAQG